MCIYGMKARVSDPAEAAAWLCDNLFFRMEKDGPEPVVENGGFRIVLCRRGSGGPGEDQTVFGWQHVALEATDIDKAIGYCRSKGMELELNENGGARYSGKVYGTGMDYFNIITGFGITIEVSQKLHVKAPAGEQVIWGLEHVGLQVPDLDEAVRYYEDLGFEKDFQPVENDTDTGKVRCCMVSACGTVIEIYAFEDMPGTTGGRDLGWDTLLIEGAGGPREVSGPVDEKIQLI